MNYPLPDFASDKDEWPTYVIEVLNKDDIWLQATVNYIASIQMANELKRQLETENPGTFFRVAKRIRK